MKLLTVAKWQGVLLAAIVLACACNSSDLTKPKRASSETTSTIDSVPQETSTPCFPSESDTNFSCQILLAGQWHGDEIPTGAELMEWIGLFQKPTGEFYLAKTNVNLESAFDPITDEEGQSTGKIVSTSNEDSCYVLFETPNALAEGDVQHISRAWIDMAPGAEVHFSFGDHEYTLYATEEIPSLEEENQDHLYSLNLAYGGASLLHSTVLASCHFLDDTFPSVMFAGDLDRDGLIDFIIDSSFHYNMFRPTVYLSSKAKSPQLLVPVAMHIATGC
jgi:hypothetical protein